MIGRTLHHFRVRDRLGAGGMGEVYRATDTVLGREVAIKILPPEVAQDPSRLARFRREAQLLSQLNHPHVAAIYGLEEADGVRFLALELVEGEDLAQRLSRGAIPVEEALEIAVQIAEAVEEAHNRGIVHRDLKPANVKVTPEGRVKVLDFGLAKAWGGDDHTSEAAISESPTLTRTGTMAGVILGTAAYMSPEQAKGKPVDRRADVWSFGVVLWEMLTGQRLFTGETVTDVLAAVVTKEPDLGALPRDTPLPVRRLIERCLRKDLSSRLPDIGAARLELQDVRAGRSGAADNSSPSTLPGQGRRASRGAVLWAALALVAVAIAAGLAYLRLTEPPPQPLLAVQVSINPPEGSTLSPEPLAGPPSPDGRTVLFSAAGPRSSSRPMIWARSLGSVDQRPLPATEGAQGYAFWSPDSSQLAFFAAGELRALSLADGAVRRICELPAEGLGGDWNEQGLILFSAGGAEGRIYSVSAAGGEPRLVMTPASVEIHHLPRFLPGGRRFLFWVWSSRQEEDGLYLTSLDAPDKRQRLMAGAYASYASGHLFFVRDGSLMAQPFDLARGETAGEPVVIAANVGYTTLPDRSLLGWFAATSSGVLLYFSGRDSAGLVQFAWADRTGRRLAAVGDAGDYLQLSLSPDGKQVAFEVRDRKGVNDIWVMDVARGVASRVTATTDQDETDPVWTPDGRSLAYYVVGKGIVRKGLHVGDPEGVLASLVDANPESWSPDGTRLFFENGAGAKLGIGALHVPEDGLEKVLEGGFHEDEPQLSADGRWLAYQSQRSGRYEVYIEPFRHEGERVRVSTAGGAQPKWRQDGRELFYVTPSRQLTAVDVHSSGDRVEVGTPKALFPLRVVIADTADDYAPSPDGQKFLVKLPAGGDVQRLTLNVVSHWPSLLKKP